MSSNEESKKTWGSGGLFDQYRELLSLFLMITTPFFCMLVWYSCKNYQGDFYQLYQKEFSPIDGVSKFDVDTVTNFFSHFWNNVAGKVMQAPWTDKAWNMWQFIFSFMIFEIILMKFVPGPTFVANITKTGHRPVYIDNGVPCYFISVAAIFFLWYVDFRIFADETTPAGWTIPMYLYQNFGLFLSCLNFFALLLCTFLTFKGLYFPSTKDSGTNGNWIVDFFWGTELYPRIFDIDVKQFTNCRFGLIYWQVGILCYALAQLENNKYISSSMFVSVILQSVYIFKFFWWETGYFNSMDIQHDRAGYYICWGCLVWVPSMYTLHTYYLVENPIPIRGGLPMTILITIIGLICVYCNYDCDRQRAEVRATNGNCKVFGRNPVLIHAKYQVEGSAEEKTNLLLVNGWWGVASHFHYTFEIMAAFCWCLPAMLVSSWSCYSYPASWFYWVFLSILLFDRSVRDDKRCAAKYGEYWVQYREKVPFKIIPGVV